MFTLWCLKCLKQNPYKLWHANTAVTVYKGEALCLDHLRDILCEEKK